MNKQQRLQVLELRKNGKNFEQIAEALGIKKESVKGACDRNGLGLTEEEKAVSRAKANVKRAESNRVATIKWYTEHGRDTGEELIINRLKEPFVYLGGYTDSDGTVEIVCGKCCNSFTRTVQSVRKGYAQTCPICTMMEREERDYFAEMDKLYELNRKAEEREEREWQKEQERTANTITKECVICGKQFQTSRGANKCCCSPECSRKRDNLYSTERKSKRIAPEKKKDFGINTRSLFKRDKGICWICGKNCNFEDYVMQDGTFIAGDWYPSVDHIIPVCEGGEHSWNNVKLAHRLCNSRRYWEEVSAP